MHKICLKVLCFVSAMQKGDCLVRHVLLQCVCVLPLESLDSALSDEATVYEFDAMATDCKVRYVHFKTM